MKYVSIDIETTGIQDCDIIEVGAVADDLSNLDTPVEMLPTFHCYFVQEKYQGEPFALNMHAEIFRRIAAREEGYNYYKANKFGHHFKNWLVKEAGYKLEKDRVKINAAGKNFANFDMPYLREKTDLFKHVGLRNRVLDPGILFVEDGDFAIPGLEKCKVRAGLKGYVDHTAVADAIDVAELIRIALGPIFSQKKV